MTRAFGPLYFVASGTTKVFSVPSGLTLDRSFVNGLGEEGTEYEAITIPGEAMATWLAANPSWRPFGTSAKVIDAKRRRI